MKTYLHPWMAGVGMLLLFTFAGCSSTRLVSSWSAPDGILQSYDKVLVIGLTAGKDRVLREMLENVMVQRLQQKGINAGSAYAEYGPKAFEDLTENETLEKIRQKGYDGAFTIALLDKSKEKVFTPGTVSVIPVTYRFWGYYRTVYQRIYEPGYYTESTNYILEANFYNLEQDKLLYSAQTSTFDPSSGERLATEFSDTLLQDLIKKGIIAP